VKYFKEKILINITNKTKDKIVKKKMKIKEENKDLKKKVNIAERKRNTKRGTKSWHDLRTLKKLKLNIKDRLSKSK